MNTYRVTNNNPQNFKAVIEAAGKPVAARFAEQCIVIANRHKVQLRPNGDVYMGHEQLLPMTEEEVFQALTVDELAEVKQLAYELLIAYRNNGYEMTEELIELVVTPIPLVKTQTKKRK